MKTSFFKFFAIVALISFSSCADKAKKAETEEVKEVAVAVPTAITYTTNIDESTIAWKGFKPTESHNGEISIKEGKLNIIDGVIESGKFSIDMNSIVVLDIPTEKKGNAKLVSHLKDTDFFNVENHPVATFEITDVKTSEGKTILSGNLAIKDITHNISFPVTTDVKENTLSLVSEPFSIDRTLWDIKYKSKSILGGLGDNFIKDDIEFVVTLVASKA